MTFWKRLGLLLPWRRRAAERDMREELRSLAALAAPGELGNLSLAAEDARREWGWMHLEQAIQDARYAFRALRKRPAFAATAVFSLALGIGANTALFTLINAVTWRLLPVSDPEGLFVLAQQDQASSSNGFTYQQYDVLRTRNTVAEVAAYSRLSLNVSIDGSTEPTLEGQLVTGNYFPLLGVRAVRGRLLGPEDDLVPMGHSVAVISDSYWNSRFGRDPDIVGRQVSLSGVPFTIVGVTPAEFFGVEVGTAPRIFVPVMMQPVVMPVAENLLQNPIQFLTWLRVVGRVRPGVSAPQAVAGLDVFAREPDWRPTNKRTGKRDEVRLAIASAATGLSDLRRQFSLPLLILMGVVGVVLLIACANTGSLVLARSAARRPEFALRLALGAGRGRLIRQVLVEGLVLSGLAGICGVALAFWATRGLVAYASAGRAPIALDLSPDLPVLAFTAVVSIVAGLLFTSVPAIRASRLDAKLAGRHDLASTRSDVGRHGPGGALVVAQVALSLILLVGAGLFARSLQNLHRQEAGIERARVLIVRVEPRGSDQRHAPGALDRLDRIYLDLLDRVRRIPGVGDASLAHTSPLTPIGFDTRVKRPSGDDVDVETMMVYPRYFATMGLRIVQGRDLGDIDLRPDAPRVVVVNQAFVRQILNGQAPLGVQHGATVVPCCVVLQGTPREPIEIVGVVQDSPYPDLREAPSPIMYQTFRQTATGRAQMVLHARVDGSAADAARAIRDAVQAIDPAVPMFELHTLTDEVDATLVRERLVATLSGFFGVVALVLVCVGLYGLMAFTVSRRTAEIGIRLALGASRADVRWMIVRETLALVSAGVALGVPVVWLIARLTSRQMDGLLFQLSASDPLTVVAAGLLVVGVAMGAGLLPAERAARIDPNVALRSD